MAQDSNAVVSWSELLLFRALYPILFLSVVIRLLRDPSVLSQIADWPKTYVLLAVFTLTTALYSSSKHAFDSSPFNIWGLLVILLLFALSAAHIHSSEDFKVVAQTSVLTSLGLAIWVLWTTAHLDFSAFRGGIDVNQNYVSLFELAGGVPVVHWLFGARRFWKRSSFLLLLTVILSVGLLLQSRGELIAFAAAILVMAPQLVPRKPIKGVLVAGIALFVAIGVAYSAGMLGRFSDADIGSLNGRSHIWKYALRTLAFSGPRIIYGFGYNSAQVLLPPRMTSDEWNYHNEYLNALMDGGIVGLGIFLVFLISVWRKIRSTSHPMSNVMRGWLIFLAIAGLTGVNSGAHIFWLLMGPICGAIAAENSHPSPIRPHTYAGGEMRCTSAQADLRHRQML